MQTAVFFNLDTMQNQMRRPKSTKPAKSGLLYIKIRCILENNQETVLIPAKAEMRTKIMYFLILERNNRIDHILHNHKHHQTQQQHHPDHMNHPLLLWLNAFAAHTFNQHK